MQGEIETLSKPAESIAERSAYEKAESQRRGSVPTVAPKRRFSPNNARLWINGEELLPNHRFAYLDEIYD